jgi:hypothetical protein
MRDSKTFTTKKGASLRAVERRQRVHVDEREGDALSVGDPVEP